MQMLKLFLVLFVYTVPVAMVHKLGFLTIPVAMMLCVGCVRVWWVGGRGGGRGGGAKGREKGRERNDRREREMDRSK
jgi:hypothetical protein